MSVKRVLVLGAGLVARPLVRYLLDRGVRVTLGDLEVARAEKMIDGHALGAAVSFDVGDDAALNELVAAHDLTVSLLPAPLHPRVAKVCLAHGKHMATASYISDAMRALDAEAREKGLTFLNECGVDPGIDHMSAMRIFDDVWRRGGTVRSFKSYCGGLPAPEANDNPLGYKFSWAPRGVLVAATNAARYRRDGERVEVPGGELFSDMHLVEMPGVGTFEAYPNRDSLAYIDTYGLGDIETMFRGTLRNLGHCARWKAWADLRLFDDRGCPEMEGTTYATVLRFLLGLPASVDVREAVAERLELPVDADPVETLGWLGMYDDEPLPDGVDNALDALAHAMLARMQYAPGERDMLLMHHEVIADFPADEAAHSERITMNLVDFGLPGGDSSMARTVSLPLGIGVRLILEGAIEERGVHAPVKRAFYEPILQELETLGIVCEEQTESL